MRAQYSIYSLLFCIAVAGLVFPRVDASSEMVNCLRPNSSLPLNFIPCDYDCTTNHAARSGNCTTDGNYNCICEESGEHPYQGACTYSRSFIEVPALCQCYTDLLELGPLYEQVCYLDCQCEHGAAGGICDFDTRSCTCDYTFPNGGSWNSSQCFVGAVWNATQALINAVNALNLPSLGR